jgi:UrcA family protein
MRLIDQVGQSVNPPICSPRLLRAGTAANVPGETPAIQVSYAGLDLSSRAGAEIIYRRLKGAAEHVCGSVALRQLSQSVRWISCYEKALSDAVTKLNRVQVTALYRTGHRTITSGIALLFGKVSGR